ncbi:hypothetical protein KFE25_011697 [Diacronema lutheri]|uniref:Uncharacterized protein n=1 Tax=Diacronema lutheri TaxID=2081491 RepID=A0A8J6C4B6_DIALT|nr:hypothetical protein KFE25_011697 [Diacronema lutheri]
MRREHGHGRTPWVVALIAGISAATTRADGDCACFSLCHPEEVRAFLIRLPRVESESSPWYAYLTAVYNTDRVPLPVDLRSFGAFQLPLNARQYGQLHIPWARRQCGGPQGRSMAPPCARSECERWLNLTAAREEEAASWEATPLYKEHTLHGKFYSWADGSLPTAAFSMAPMPVQHAERLGAADGDSRALGDRQHVMVRVRLQGDINPRFHRAGLEPYNLYIWPEDSRLRAPREGSWAEVTRTLYNWNPEGVLYGCFFTQLMEPFPRGSGVFVRKGKSLFTATKAAAISWAAELGTKNVAPAPSPPRALASEAAWAAHAAKVWASRAAAIANMSDCPSTRRPRPSAAGMNGSGMARARAEGERGCVQKQPVEPADAAGWAAAAAAAAAAELARRGSSTAGRAADADAAAAGAERARAAADATAAAEAARTAKSFARPASARLVRRSRVAPGQRNHCAPWRKAPHDLASLASAALPGGRATSLLWFKHLDDVMLAGCARQMGFDTVEVGTTPWYRPELVIAGPECTWPGQPSPPGECGAPETPLRTGWHAERPCACTPGDRQACAGSGRREARELLNCGVAPLCQVRNVSMTRNDS